MKTYYNRLINSWLFSLVCLVGMSTLHAQTSLTVTPSSPTRDFYLTATGLTHVDGFHLPTGITNQIGDGFSVDVTFSTVGMSASTGKTLVFGIGMNPSSNTFNNAIMVYIEKQQLIVERRISTPNNGDQTFSMPSWNTQMYQYGKSNVRLYFWINEYAMKMYMFEGTTNLTQNDPKRTCELQFYGMNSSRAKSFLTNTSNGTASIVVPRRSPFTITTLTITPAKTNVTGSPITVNAVQGGEATDPVTLTDPSGTVALRENAVSVPYANQLPLDVNSSTFDDLPTSYPVSYDLSVVETTQVDPRTPSFWVSPVPTNDHIMVNMLATQHNTGQLEILDLNERIIYRQTVEMQEGHNQYKVSLKAQSLAAGMYLVRLRISGDMNMDKSSNLYILKVILK